MAKYQDQYKTLLVTSHIIRFAPKEFVKCNRNIRGHPIQHVHLVFVGPYTKYRSDLVVNLQYVCLMSVLGNFKSSDWSTQFMQVHALIGQNKLGDTKPVL